jgi:hypothetical protein
VGGATEINKAQSGATSKKKKGLETLVEATANAVKKAINK